MSHQAGRAGEDVAAEALRRRGLRVVERNFRRAGGEIDLVARRGGLVVFCEVKARRTERWGTAAGAVDARKQARIRRAAAAWLRERRAGRCTVRFDVVTVVGEGRGARVEVIEDAF